LDRPLIFAAWNDGVAVGFGLLPGRAKAGGVEFPSARTLGTRLSARFADHRAFRREDHFEFGAARRGSGKWSAVEEDCLDLAGHHRRSKGSACREEYAYDGEWSYAHQEILPSKLTSPARRLKYMPNRGPLALNKPSLSRKRMLNNCP
jgi:hypothetical protein